MRTQESTITRATVDAVENRVYQLCRQYAARLQFHGWHHVSFVRAKAVGFAQRNGADRTVVEVAALVHDVNYLVRRNSPAAAGRSLRMEILEDCSVNADVARWIDEIVDEVEARLAVIQTAVDMGRRNVDQVRRGHYLRGARDDPHRAGDAVAEIPAQHRVVAVAQLQHRLLLVTRTDRRGGAGS